MNKHFNKDSFDNYKLCRNPKQRIHSSRKNLSLLLCCCLAAIIAIIGLSFDTSKDISTSFSSVGVSQTNNSKANTDGKAWHLILVNRWNYIPKDYKVNLTKLTNEQFIDKRIYPALQKMFDTARNDNIYPIVASGYRTKEKQQSLMDEKIAEYKRKGYSSKKAIVKAEAWVAIPGTSEHQLGLSVDINADGINSTDDEVYKWLNQNSYKFGFILRYPANKIKITEVINEPWHYRYVGIKVATEIYKQGICLEEYLSNTK